MTLTARRILMAIALVLFAIFTLTSLGSINTTHPFAWLGGGLLFMGASQFP